MKKKNKKTGKPSDTDHPIPVSPASFSPLSLTDNPLVHIACLVVLILLIYSNTFKAPFQWDESEYMVNNPIVKDLHYFVSPTEARGFEHYYNYLILRYIGFLTFALNYKMHGFSVTGYHIVNIAIHVANSILVYFLVLLTCRTPYFNKTVDGQCIKEEEVKVKPFSRLTFHVSRPLNGSRPLVAFFSAALFAVHPLQTMAVTYVFQRFASLVAFFYLLSLIFYIKARIEAVNSELKPEKKPFTIHDLPCTIHGRFTIFVWFFLSLFFAVCAMKTKENAFTLPIVITLYEFCFFPRFSTHGSHSSSPFTIHHSRFLFLAPMLLTMSIIPLTLVYLKGTAGGGTHFLPGLYVLEVLSRKEYMLTEFRVIVTYLRLLFLPVNQNIDYDYPVFKSVLDPQVMLSFLFLSAFFAFGVYLVIKTADNTKEKDSGQAGITKKVSGPGKFLTFFGPRHSGLSGSDSRLTFHDSRSLIDSRPLSDSRLFRLMGFGILWFFITISVESSIIPLIRLIDEYRVYLPSVGISIAVVTGAFLVFSRFTSHVSRILIVLLVLATGLLSVATYRRNELWADSIKLWKDTAEKSPLNAIVHNNLGNSYQANSMLDKALEQYLIASKLSPDFVEAHNNLGTVYKLLNMPDKAMEQYLIATRLKPDDAEPHYNLGVFYQDYNMLDKAMEQYLITIKLRPDIPEPHYNLGIIYQSLTMFDKAIEQYLIVVSLSPDDADAHNNLGFAYYKTGQMEKARIELAAGLKIKPDDQRAKQLLKEITSP